MMLGKELSLEEKLELKKAQFGHDFGNYLHKAIFSLSGVLFQLEKKEKKYSELGDKLEASHDEISRRKDLLSSNEHTDIDSYNSSLKEFKEELIKVKQIHEKIQEGYGEIKKSLDHKEKLSQALQNAGKNLEKSISIVTTTLGLVKIENYTVKAIEDMIMTCGEEYQLKYSVAIDKKGLNGRKITAGPGFRAILDNLWRNIIKYSGRETSELEIIVEGCVEKHEILGECYKISISNNGEPFTTKEGVIIDEPTKVIFEKNYTTQGTGVGLWLIHSLMERVYKGFVTAENRKEGGVSFNMYFPLTSRRERIKNYFGKMASRIKSYITK